MLLELVELAREADADVTYANVLPEKVGHLVAGPGALLSLQSFYDTPSTSFRSCYVATYVGIAMQTFSYKAQSTPRDSVARTISTCTAQS